MFTGQGHTLQSLRAVNAFLDLNAIPLADVVTTGARQQLSAVIAELTGHASVQIGSTLSAQGSTQKQRSLRQSLLRDHMVSVSRIAKANLPHIPELLPLRMPRGRPSVERLAAAAYGMATAAEPHAATFVAAGLPVEFIAQLKGAVDAMVTTLSERSQSRGRRTGATRGLKARLSAGRKLVGVLDGFVRSVLKDDPALLASWNIVKRVQRTAIRITTITPIITPTPRPVPAPAPSPTPTPVPAPTPVPTPTPTPVPTPTPAPIH